MKFKVGDRVHVKDDATACYFHGRYGTVSKMNDEFHLKGVTFVKIDGNKDGYMSELIPTLALEKVEEE